MKGCFVFGGFVPNGRKFEEPLASRRRGRKVEYVSSARAGFTSLQNGKVRDAIWPLLVKSYPFSNLPETGKSRWGRGLDEEKMQECRWVDPKVKATVAFVEWTEGGKLRHARFVSMS